MLKSATVSLAILIAGATASAAHAGDGEEGRMKIGVTAGTLGIGPEIGYRLSETVGLRANATFITISGQIDGDDLTYDASLKLKSGGVMVDLYPFGGGFRVSGGLRANGNGARAIAIPNSGSNYEIDGTTYTAAQIGTLTAETDVKGLAPSLTIGYGGGLSKGLSFGIEAGVLFQGSVTIKPLTFTGVCASSSPPAGCATLAADLDAERLSVNDDISGYKAYPILQFSIGYRF